jgi:hypothetical protein
VLLAACFESEPKEAPEQPPPGAVEPLPQDESAPAAAGPPPAAEVPAAREPAAPPKVVARSVPPAPGPAEPPPQEIDLDGLEQRLRDTKSLGVLTKLALKNDIDDLVEDVDAFHHKGRGTLQDLRERFDLLVMKIMSLLQEKSPDLAQEIARSREGLWRLLADPAEFAKLST